jgi:hypothetical protein
VVTRIGRYEVVAEIGRGGMGTVYEARDPELERRVAIKLLHAQHAGLVREEARALAALNHGGIVTIHEIGEHEGRPYLVMELLRGRPLRLVLADAPTRERVVDVCADVARALAEAHDRGVLHRDIKPENVVVLDAGGVKVVDFGIARRLDGPDALAALDDVPGASRATRIVSAFARTIPFGITPAASSNDSAATVATLASATQTVFGTPAYMAPEVLAGGSSSPASDIYSLGVVLYECLAGKRPFEAPELVNVVAMVLDGEAPPPLADPLAPLISRMMAREPAQRPTARDVAAALTGAPDARSARGIAAIVGGVAVFGLALGAWRMAHRTPAGPHGAAAIAVAPLTLQYATYGDGPGTLANALAIVLGGIDGVRIVVEPSQLAQGSADAIGETAYRLGATHLVSGKLVEHDGVVDADLELVDLASHKLAHVVGHAPVAQNAALVDTLANDIAGRLVAGAHLEPADRVALARKLAELGTAELAAQHWGAARPYLEQAAQEDPAPWQTWKALAEARAWTLAPQAWIDDAAARSVATIPAGPRRTIAEGTAAFLRHDYTAAIATLEPLLATLSGDDALDVAYTLGEAYWHRGDHTRGTELLQRVFDARRGFEPAGLHLMQYAIVHRDLSRAGVLIGQLRRSRQVYLFAAGEYAAVAASGEHPLDVQARLVLGEQLAPELEAMLGEGPDGHAYRIARAVAAGNVTTAREEFAATWERSIARQPLTDTLLFSLSNLTEVVASSGLREETSKLLELLHAGKSPRYALAYRHLAALAAPIAGTPPPTGAVFAREQSLQAASEAELAGNHREAARLLAELVADPDDTWDFGERIALVRNLRALDDVRAVAAQCKEITHPPTFRYVFVLARHACE